MFIISIVIFLVTHIAPPIILFQSRQVLAQQLSISKALTQKIRSNEDSDPEDDAANAVLGPSGSDRDNPWVNGVKTESEIDAFISGYRKYWEEKNKDTKGNDVQSNDRSNTEKTIKKKKQIPSSKQRVAINPVESVTEEYANETVNGNATCKKPKPTKTKKTKAPAMSKENDVEPEAAVLSKRASKTLQSEKKTNAPAVLKVNGIEQEAAIVPKCASKIRKAKKAAKPEMAGTSMWQVEPLANNLSKNKANVPKSLEIDDLFESMEDKMISRIDTKLKRVKRKLATNAAAYDKCIAAQEGKRSKPEYSPDLSFKKRKLRPDLDEEMDESTGISGNQAVRQTSTIEENLRLANGLADAKSSRNNTSTDIDPNKFINVKPKHMKHQLPDTITGGDEALDDSEGEGDQHNIISEAFADDDVVDDFRKEKAEEVNLIQYFFYHLLPVGIQYATIVLKSLGSTYSARTLGEIDFY